MPSTTRARTTKTGDMAERNAAAAVVNQGSLSARAVGQSQYLPEWSEPDSSEPRNRFWSSGYTMEIVNGTTRAVRIERRHWEIQPNGGELETTDGAGIGGQVRVIRPGETFRYWSATPLSGPDGGWMTGQFSGRFDDGDREPVTIPVARTRQGRREAHKARGRRPRKAAAEGGVKQEADRLHQENRGGRQCRARRDGLTGRMAMGVQAVLYSWQKFQPAQGKRGSRSCTEK
jgi:uncharacterized protein affecting Mg2+/Co2+ transport